MPSACITVKLLAKAGDPELSISSLIPYTILISLDFYLDYLIAVVFS